MFLIQKFSMSPADAWNMTMREYSKLMTVEKDSPINPIYDSEERERIIVKGELARLERG